MPAIKQSIYQSMKMEANPLVYLEYFPNQDLTKPFNRMMVRFFRERSEHRFCMGYVSHPYAETFRITTCRHLVADKNGHLPSKEAILKGLEVFARFEGINQRLHSLLFEDVNIKVHADPLTDLLFIEINHPDDYNFQLLNQACAHCGMRIPGHQVYYFQHHEPEQIFRFLEGQLTNKQVYITGITDEGNFFYQDIQPQQHHRVFQVIHTTKAILIKGASGSPILSRKGEVVGMICAHDQESGLGIYLSIEKIERLYGEIEGYHL